MADFRPFQQVSQKGFGHTAILLPAPIAFGTNSEGFTVLQP